MLSVELFNFKAFKHLRELPLKGLTILCGPNAAGKSSVLQSILLLQQNVSPMTISRDGILLSGTSFSLGSLETMARTAGEPVRFIWKTSLGADEFRAQLRTLVGSRAADLFENALVVHAELDLSLEPRWDPQGGAGGSAQVNTLSITLTTMALGPNNLPVIGPPVRVILRPSDRAFSEGEWLVWLEEEDIEDPCSVEPYEFVMSIHGFVPVVETLGVPAEPHVAGTAEQRGLRALSIAEGAIRAISQDAGRWKYLGPLRERPRRVYSSDQDLHAEDGTGADAVSLLYAHRHERVRVGPDIAERMGFDPSESNCDHAELETVARHWLAEMGFPGLEIDRLVPEAESQRVSDYGYRVRFDHNVNIADTGFGLSQVFPIVIHGLAPNSDMLLLEQPEAQLHPRLQNQLADFLIYGARLQGKTVVVETHSDHLVNRVVRRIVEGSLNPDDVTILFFTPTVDGPHVEEIAIDPLFGIRNWPMGFFDQYVDEQEAIIRASLARRSEEGRN